MSHADPHTPFSGPRRLALVLAAGLLLVALAPALRTNGARQVGDAALRVIHASPNAGPIDVYVGEDLLFPGVGYGAVTDFAFVAAGERDVTVVQAGDPAPGVVPATVALDAGNAYEAVVVGLVPGIVAQVYPVDVTRVPEGEARVRFVHASVDAPVVDVAMGDGDLLFEGVDYGSATDYATLSAGVFDLTVTPADDGEAVLTVSGLELTAGNVYDVVAIGQVENNTLDVLTAIAQPEVAQVAGRPVRIYQGTCDTLDPTQPILALNNVVAPQGTYLGAEEATNYAYSITIAGISLDELLAGDHAIAVHHSEADLETVVACGEVGGIPIETGAIVIELRPQAESDLQGLAYLDPSGNQTIASVYLPQTPAPPGSGVDEGDASPAAIPATPAAAPTAGQPPGPPDVG